MICVFPSLVMSLSLSELVMILEFERYLLRFLRLSPFVVHV